MEDKTKKYKGIKFLNVGQHFVGVEKTKKYSSNALSINHNFPMFNKVDTLRVQEKIQPKVHYMKFVLLILKKVKKNLIKRVRIMI